MTVADGTVVGTPGSHNRVDIRKIPLTGCPRYKPRGRPGGVGPLVQRVVHLLGKVHRPALGDLQYRPLPLHQVDPGHRHRHTPTGKKVGGKTAAPEVTQIGGTEPGVFDTRSGFLTGNLPERLHRRLPVFFLPAGTVKSGGPAVDQVDDTVFRNSPKRVTGNAFDRVGTPVRPDITEYLGRPRHKVTKEHDHAVEAVVFGGEDVRSPNTVPVEAGVKHGLHEVTVGQVVRPLPLPLKSRRNCVVTQRFFTKPAGSKSRIAPHEVLSDKGHLDRRLPLTVFLLPRVLCRRGVGVFPLFQVFFHPRYRPLVLFRIVYLKFYSSGHFAHVHVLVPHTQVFLEEIGVHRRTANTHGNRADGEVGLTPQNDDRRSRPGKPENLLLHIRRDGVVIQFLYFMTVDTKRRQPLLGVGGQYRRQVDRTRALGPVKTPDRLDRHRVHIHRFGAVTPARRHRKSRPNPFPFKLCLARRRLSDPPDS